MRKILIVANNCQWSSWPEKIQQLKTWFSQRIDFDIKLIHTQLQDIPFESYVSSDPNQNKYKFLQGIKKDWYDENISTLGVGYDIVLFVVNRNQWPFPNNARGWRTDRNYGPIELQVGADENETVFYGEKNYHGPAFFELARHEILHACFMITQQEDTVHYWWDRGSLNDCILELKFGEPNIAEKISLYQALLMWYQKLLAKVKLKEESMKTDRLIKFANAIKEFEGWFEGSKSYRNNNPGNLKYVGQSGATEDRTGFAVFKTYEEGFGALLKMIQNAATGKSKVYSKDMTVLKFFQKYAPSSDNNHPEKYAEFVAKKTGILISDPISILV